MYKRKRAEMLTKANTMLEAYYLGQLKNLHKKAVSQFSNTLRQALKTEDAGFSKIVTKARKEAIDFFTKGAKLIQLEDTDWGFEEETVQLEQDLQELATVQREKELGKMVTTLEKTMKRDLEEPVTLALDRPGARMWGQVVTAYQQAIKDGDAMLERRARTFDLTEQELEELKENLRRQGWILTTTKVQEESVDGLMVYRLLNQFEEKFQRDDSGLPRVWKPDDDIDTPFRKARDEVTLTTTIINSVICTVLFSYVSSLTYFSFASRPSVLCHSIQRSTPWTRQQTNRFRSSQPTTSISISPSTLSPRSGNMSS